MYGLHDFLFAIGDNLHDGVSVSHRPKSEDRDARVDTAAQSGVSGDPVPTTVSPPLRLCQLYVG